MEAIISDLVKRFERGTLSRRHLIQGLTMLAAASSEWERRESSYRSTESHQPV